MANHDSVENLALSNQMKDAYYNRDFNVFEQGIAPADCKKPENRRILLRNVSKKLTKAAVLRLLEKFGTVSDDRIDIPKNQDGFNNNDGFMCVFAEFETLAAAEKACRELNSEKNRGLEIRAQFAYRKDEAHILKSVTELIKKDAAELERVEFESVVEKSSCRPPITVNYDYECDDIYERVTAFERKKIPITIETFKQLEFWKQLASQSKGGYENETECFIYNKEIIDLVPKNHCSNCDNEALLQCDKSKLFFCSIKCSEMKEESLSVFNNSLGKNQIIGDQPIKIGDVVVIAGIINEKCLYLRRANIDDSLLMNSVLKHSKRASKFEVFPDLGDLAIVKYEDEAYRAKVIAISDEKPYEITVQLIDYGNTLRVHLKDLLVMGTACQRIECTAHKVLLKDVKIEAINSYIISYLENLLEKKVELAVKSIDSNEAVLVDKSTGINLNHKIVEFSVVEHNNEDEEGVILTDYEPETVISDETRKVLVVNSNPFEKDSEIICCVSELRIKDLRELYRGINVYANQRKSKVTGLPRQKDEVCLVFCNDQWHRAVHIKSYGDGRPKCLLLDLWSFQKIDINQIIPMPKAFKFPAPMSELCKYTPADAEITENDWLIVKEKSIDEKGFCKLVLN